MTVTIVNNIMNEHPVSLETWAPRAGLPGTGWFILPQGLPLPSPRSPRVPGHSHPASLQAWPQQERGAYPLQPGRALGKPPTSRSVVLGTLSAGSTRSQDTEPNMSISRPPPLGSEQPVRALHPAPSSACRPATHPDHACAVPALHTSSPCLSPMALGGGLSSRPHSSPGQPKHLGQAPSAQPSRQPPALPFPGLGVVVN